MWWHTSDPDVVAHGPLALLVGPLLPLLVALPPTMIEINAANVNILAVAAVVWGFRWPGLWAFPLLTKVTLVIGLLWFAARREWHQLAIALGAMGAIAAISIVYRPDLWLDWVAFLRSLAAEGSAGFMPVWIRLPIAALLVAWGARTDRPWTVGLAMFVAIPRLYPLSPVARVAIIPLAMPGVALIRTQTGPRR